MRITREMLLKLAKDTTEKRFKPDPNVVAVFLVGSMRTDDDPLLGGTTDVDLLVITKGEPDLEREIIKISAEIHLDLMFESEKAYAKPRELRADPWRGWAMWDPLLLYEKGRFFEYTQSSLRAQFDDPSNVLARARYFAGRARDSWATFQFGGEADPAKYLLAVQDAANSLAVMNGAPLPERRLFSGFAERAKKAKKPELANTLTAMIGGLDVSADDIRAWLGPWETAFSAATQAPVDLRVHPVRLAYYKSAILAALDAKDTSQALWLVLHSWALSAQARNWSAEQTTLWDSACKYAGLAGTSFELRLQSMDHFLDAVEELLDKMSTQYG